MGPLDDWMAKSLKRSGDSTRPSITLSYAQSLDGSISLRRGEPLALSGPESKQLTHKIRAAHDGILVGIGTVLSDDPQLNVRLAEGRNPQTVVLDSQLRLPLTARLLNGSPRVFCVASASREMQKELEQAGAVIERQTDEKAIQVNLREMLSRLKEIGVRHLMVEGGGRIISSFLSEDLVDQVIITIAPQFVGGYKSLDRPLNNMPTLVNEEIEKYGKDFVIWGDVKK